MPSGDCIGTCGSVDSPFDDVVSVAVYNCVSSTNWWHRISNVETRLPNGVVKMENSSGLRTEPCGTMEELYLPGVATGDADKLFTPDKI